MVERLSFDNVKDLEDRELQRIEDFQDTLGKISIHSIDPTIDMSHPRPASIAVDRFLSTSDLPEKALYLLPEYTTALGEAELLGFEPYVSTGSKTSGHGVFFGALYFADGRELEVAVKPHDAKDPDPEILRKMQVSCLGDFYKNLAAHEAKFEGLHSVGVVIDKSGVPYSLTLLDSDLSTLDSIDWTNFHKEGFDDTGMRILWDKAAVLVADVHDEDDSSHGDLAPRNFATHPEGLLELIDWEMGNVTNFRSDLRTRTKRTHDDLRRLMYSMLNPPDIGKLSGVDMFKEFNGDWWDGFRDVFFDTYQDWRLALAQQGSHKAQVVRETEEEMAEVAEKLRMDALIFQDRYNDFKMSRDQSKNK